LIPGDPDGKNIAFFTEYPEAIRIDAVTFNHRSGAYGELSYRPNQPLLIGPGDGVAPFLSPTAPALFRQDANAIAPGGLFHGYERYGVWQAQLGFQRPLAADAALGYSFEVVAKRVVDLPDQALRRYGRSDVFGTGPINGVCTANMTVPALQCSQRGYVSSMAAAWRARIETRLPPLTEALVASAALGFVYDVRGWSADALINEGRRSANLALRAQFRQRYQFELAWSPVWGGDYNAGADRDVLAISIAVKF
jgi:peptidoglycan hydrolase-like protein with peptidoglycan-binding domain